MKESLIQCPKCKSEICSEVSNDKFTIWNCFACGFTSNSTMFHSNKKQTEEFLPELYKALCFIDDKGYSWYPNSVIQENKSMLFAEGKSISDWKWSAVKSKDGKPDMTTKKEFEQGDFAKALVYIS